MTGVSCKIIVLIALTCVVLAGEDFYGLLGVEKGASVQQIRKAFKKTALAEHPDKNTGDPEAHDKFVKINRAYEVLKDEDLRKKYDQFGEEGLEDKGQQRGWRYESWNYYKQDFGIYDDDPEVITLSKADFEQSVEDTGEPWFINFYSGRCSHCHDLAPFWRKMAKELMGVIRVGAVNCQDDWQLCRMQGINNYPSLMFYGAQRRPYHGSRTVEAMVEEALRNVKAIQFDLSGSKFQRHVMKQATKGPWLITFCGDDGDCLEGTAVKKVAAILADLVNVGRIECASDPWLCKDLGRDHGTVFFTEGNVHKDKGVEMNSLDTWEISQTVLEQLPDMENLDQGKLKRIEENTDEQTWLIHFVNNLNNIDLELRKLPGLLNECKVGRVDCSKMGGDCVRLHIVKYPSFMLFKEIGGREVYYGARSTPQDLTAWVRDSEGAPMENLGPQDFPARVVDSGDPWFVDFFAPWCPPCMKLLPEFKKASKIANSVNFGTVDCTVHSNLCNKYNIQSYPTTIFYNASTPHKFNGQHDASGLIEFVEDTMNPPVVILDPASFQELVKDKGRDQVWLVDFFAPWCGPCQQLAPEWRRVAKSYKDKKNVFVGQVDCSVHSELCRDNSVNSYPTIRLYPTETNHNGRFQSYTGWRKDEASIKNWAADFLPSKVVILTSQNFKTLVLQSVMPWVVDFYAPWCGHCQIFRPEFEEAAEDLVGFALLGKVDCDNRDSQQLCRDAMLRSYPTVFFYRGVQPGGTPQNARGQQLTASRDDVVRFVKSNTRNKLNEQVKDEL